MNACVIWSNLGGKDRNTKTFRDTESVSNSTPPFGIAQQPKLTLLKQITNLVSFQETPALVTFPPQCWRFNLSKIVSFLGKKNARCWQQQGEADRTFRLAVTMKAIIPQVEPKFKYQIHVDVKCIRWQRLRARCVVKIGQIGFDALIVRAQGGCPAVAVPSRFIALLTPEMQAAITTAVLGAWREGGER